MASKKKKRTSDVSPCVKRDNEVRGINLASNPMSNITVTPLIMLAVFIWP